MRFPLGHEISAVDLTYSEPLLAPNILKEIYSAEVVVADISEANPNVMYQLGLAHSAGKPVILISDGKIAVPFDITMYRVLIYDIGSSHVAFKAELKAALKKAFSVKSEAFKDPMQVFEEVFGKSRRKTVFISYSHVDIDYLKRIKVHLRPLERADLIDPWDDTRIKGGQRWKKEIESALSRSGIAILLVSADFLASDFITNNELPPLLRAAEKNGTTILPLILKPCGFVRNKELSVFQAINDPMTPLIGMNESDRESAYAKLAERIEAVLAPEV